MRKLSSVAAGVFGGALLLCASSAQADTLLLLIDPPGQTATPHALDFTATATTTTTTISIGGYDFPAVEYVSEISVTQKNGGANLLGSTWAPTPAASGTFATPLNDGTS